MDRVPPLQQSQERKTPSLESRCCTQHHIQSGIFMSKDSFRGNKAYLPSKHCAVCGRVMTWRKNWAKNWESVKYCSEACRRKKGTPTA